MEYGGMAKRCFYKKIDINLLGNYLQKKFQGLFIEHNPD